MFLIGKILRYLINALEFPPTQIVIDLWIKTRKNDLHTYFFYFTFKTMVPTEIRL